MEEKRCAFCALDPARVVIGSERAVVILDAYPVNDGHALVIPRRHVQSWFDATVDERSELIALLDLAKHYVGRRRPVDGFTIGINDGPAAGQTVPHLHVHLIPRYRGDVADPRGGVRWVIPERARYWDRG
jgi:diadenosine tetraphosphate (Ap4A) HIT family hydrolase